MKRKLEKFLINFAAVFCTVLICLTVVGLLFMLMFFVSEYCGGFWAFMLLVCALTIIITLFLNAD